MSRMFDDIKEIHRKTTAGAKEGVAFRYFSRPLASFILYFIQHGRITPNQVTIASLIVGIVGSVVHVFALSWAGLLAGGFLFMMAHMLDALDGQLARLRKAGSVVGMHFDFFIDGVKAFLMYAALSIRVFRQGASPGTGGAPYGERLGDPTWLYSPLVERFGLPVILVVAVVGLVALATGVACTDFMKKKEWKEAFATTAPAAATRTPIQKLIHLVLSLGHFVVDYPSYILILCILNRADLYLLAYTVVVAAYAVQALTGISRKLWRVDPYQPKT